MARMCVPVNLKIAMHLKILFSNLDFCLKICFYAWTSHAGIEASSTAEDAAQMAETRQKYLPMPNLLCVQETVTAIKLACIVTRQYFEKARTLNILRQMIFSHCRKFCCVHFCDQRCGLYSFLLAT